MEKEPKLFTEAEALEEASRMKELAGENASKEELDLAEEMIEAEREMTPEAKEAIKLYLEAFMAESEADQEKKALAFAQKMSSIVEPNPKDPTGEKRWAYPSRRQVREMIFGDSRPMLIVGSGTSGCRIRFEEENPRTDEKGHWMYYFKPSEMDWPHGGKFWENFMTHFKQEIVKLEETQVGDSEEK